MPPPAARPSLARLATRGALWTGFGHYVTFALGLAKAIILARLIGREYFGLLAGAAVWASYLSFARLDLRLAVLKSREEPETLNTQFLLENASASAGLMVAALLALVWPHLASPTVWWLIFVLLAAAQLEALTSTSVYLTERRLRQDVLGRFTALAAVIGSVVPVLVALGGAALPALLVDAVLPVLIPRLGSLLFTRWRPAFVWDPRQLREQLRLAWTLWSTGLLGKITYQFDDWLVFNLNRPRPVIWLGSGVEPEALYDRAYSLGKLPMDLVAGMIGGNALSLYVESAARGREVLVAVYRQVTWILAWMIFASGTYAFVAADDLVHILGEQWVPMVPLLRLMILFVVGRPLFQNHAQLLLAMRRERDVRAAMAVQAVFILLACPPAVYWFGAAGASVVVSVMSLIGLVIAERRVTRSLGSPTWPLYVVPGSAAIAVLALVAVLGPTLPASIWLSATVKGIVSALGFGTALWLFDRAAALEAWRIVRRGVRRE